jgi:hypothetical protein
MIHHFKEIRVRDQSAEHALIVAKPHPCQYHIIVQTNGTGVLQEERMEAINCNSQLSLSAWLEPATVVTHL